MPYISKRNRQALILVIVLSIIIVYIPRILLALDDPEGTIQISDAEIAETKNKIATYRNSKKYYSYNKRDKKSRFQLPPSRFDPNNYTLREWMELGLSEKQAAVVLKFTSRGLKSNEDLQRVFVISDELFELIKDSTFYPSIEKTENLEKGGFTKKEKPQIIVELNSASQEDLVKIPGIGESFAKWIINYRSRLGGFSKPGQLLEVWKIDVEKYAQIEPFVTVNVNQITKLKLNTITVEELKKHPYLNWNIANSIIKIRERKKGFNSIEEIKESVLIDEECFEKLKPYLSL
jgi:DNA uptake protein ComE-like DNA-binding protein